MKKLTSLEKNVYLAEAGLIAAIYVIVSLLTSVIGMTYGPVQFRLAECLYILFLSTPAMVPGVTLGCIITNFMSPYGAIDIAIGGLASLLAGFLAYKFRNKKVKNIPLISMIFPVVVNSLLVGAEIALMQSDIDVSLILFLKTVAEVAVSEVVSMALGYFLYTAIDMKKILRKDKSDVN